MHIIQNYIYHDIHLQYWYFNDRYHDTTRHKLIEIPKLYIKIITFLGLKYIQTVNMFPFGFLLYYSGLIIFKMM